MPGVGPNAVRESLTRENAYAAINSTLQGARVLWVKLAPPTHDESLAIGGGFCHSGVVCKWICKCLPGLEIMRL